MKRVEAAEFRDRCFDLLDSLGREGLVITRVGRPIARVLPIEPGCAHLIGSLRGLVRVRGDLLSSGARWNE